MPVSVNGAAPVLPTSRGRPHRSEGVAASRLPPLQPQLAVRITTRRAAVFQSNRVTMSLLLRVVDHGRNCHGTDLFQGNGVELREPDPSPALVDYDIFRQNGLPAVLPARRGRVTRAEAANYALFSYGLREHGTSSPG